MPSARNPHDPRDERFCSQFVSTTGETLSVSGTAARNSSALGVGVYRVSASADCCIKQGTSSVTAVWSTNGHAYLAAGAIDFFDVDDATANGYLSAITDGTQTGILTITKV